MRYLNPVPASENWLGEYNTLYDTHSMQHHISQGFMRYVDALLFRWGHIWSRNHSLHAEPGGPGQGRKILDIGCSSGDKLDTYVRREFEVYGIDITGSAIADARRHVKGTFLVGTIEEAQLPEAFFDFVRFDNVLEHIYDPRAFLKKVYALLKPGGTAFGYVPNGISPTMQILGKYSISSWVPFHLNLFTPICLKILAREAGFSSSVRGIADPHMVMQSVRQWRHRDRQNYNETAMDWIDRVVRAGAAPLSWLLNKVWQGEELILIARKD
jgi:ubiquinone/menaquinone biosynthesis C-methylase UbiE